MAEYAVRAYKGYFIGSFALPSGDGRFMGRAQICVERPKNAQSAKPLEQVSSVGNYPDADKAVRAAEYQARTIIDSLGPNWAPFTAPGSLISR